MEKHTSPFIGNFLPPFVVLKEEDLEKAREELFYQGIIIYHTIKDQKHSIVKELSTVLRKPVYCVVFSIEYKPKYES